jgi:protocatechuate 3,4-dioxygenase beta subunit
MKTGRSLAGTVLSPTGRPVAGATVVIQSRADRKTLQRVQSGPDGRFRTGPFIDPEWSEFTMVVQAEGFASAAQTLLVPAEFPPQDIRLSPRKPLHGRVVDAQGRPLPGAVVRSATEFGFAGLEWEAEADADGRFVWYEAPASGTYMLNIEKPPFRQIVALLLPGGSDDLEIILHRPQHLHGTVTDAATGRPIERFVVIEGWGPIRPGWSPDWHRDSARSFAGGQYDLTRSGIEQQMVHSLRVEADGYEAADFLGFPDGTEDLAHDFSLHRAVRLAGVVRGADGRPMAGVDVVLTGSGSQADIENGRLLPGSSMYRSPRMRTGPDGRYEFRPQGHRVSVIAAHDSGIAVCSADDLAASTDLTLSPWARIEGRLMVGDQPASGERVVARLMAPGWGGVSSYKHTLASGRFVMDRVAPGRIMVYRRVETQDQGWMASHPVFLDVKPGETVRIQLGGTGRPVVGRLAIPEGVKLSQFAAGHVHGSLVPVLPEPPTPDDFLAFDSERLAAWWEALSRTPEGRAYVEDHDRSYAVALRPDGTFRVEDVPPGRYVLKVPFEGVSRSSREGRQAFAQSQVTVAEIPGGRSDEPLDIGAIPLEVFPFHEPRVGEPAPQFDGNLPDGRPLDLAARRGKFLLLHFWSGRPEDAAVVPHLKATFHTFGRDPRFVMIGLIADETPGPVRRYCARYGLSWEQRYIGSTYDPNRYEAAFGVWFPPKAFLIGPDGRIVAKDLEGEAIRRAVARVLASRPQPLPPEGAVEPQEGRRALTLEIVGDEGKTPLSGASVWAQLDWKQPRISQGRADEEGHFTIDLPARAITGLRVAVAHPGFVPLEFFWAEDNPIPESFTVALETGVPIGGTVRDEQGRPIVGVRVHVRVFARPRVAGSYAGEECENAAAVTDEQGRWRSGALPVAAAPDATLELLATHPDHVAVSLKVTAETLRALASTVVMKTGRSVSGTVSSPTGRPVAGATVIVQHRNAVGGYMRLRTDDHGGFRTGRFLDPTWDDLTLTVQADDFASVVRRLANTPEIPPQLVRLLPRKPFQGRVVDTRGRPIAGALITPTWGFGFGKLEWEARTDAAGRFRWFEAPASGSFLIEVSKAGYRPIEFKEVAAGMEDLSLTLHRPQRLHGTVTDAETGRPIERFALLSAQGGRHRGITPQWDRAKARSFTEGRFDLTGERSSDQDTYRSIRIEADGYEPAEFRDFSDHEDDVVHDFKLRRTSRKAIALSGIVRDAAGEPVAGADVLLGDREHRIDLSHGRLGRRDAIAPYWVQTDREGRYAFPPQLGEAWLVAVHDAGFAIRSRAEVSSSTEITLAPWGRIEGVVKIGREPAAGKGVDAYLQDRRFPGSVDHDSSTDRDGRFSFDRVAPGRWTLYLPIRQEMGSVLSQLTHVEVAPGRTARIQLGGTGRPVVGRLALPNGVTMNHLAARRTRLQSAPPALRLPLGSDPLTDEQWDAWWDAFLKTPECEDFYFGEHQYLVEFQPDGTFRIEDVPAGRYILKLPFVGNGGGDRSELRAFAQKSVTVPPIPGGRSDEPLDIGTLPLEVFPSRNLGVGDRVLAVTARLADGRPLDLAALRGKFVLLVFWHASQSLPRSFIPPVKATWEAFGRDPRLAIIGLNGDSSAEIMRRYLADKGLDWDQRYVGDREDFDPISAAFGVRWPGGVFLVGPDGRLIARDLRADTIKQAVAKALR